MKFIQHVDLAVVIWLVKLQVSTTSCVQQFAKLDASVPKALLEIQAVVAFLKINVQTVRKS